MIDSKPLILHLLDIVYAASVLLSYVYDEIYVKPPVYIFSLCNFARVKENVVESTKYLVAAERTRNSDRHHQDLIQADKILRPTLNSQLSELTRDLVVFEQCSSNFNGFLGSFTKYSVNQPFFFSSHNTDLTKGDILGNNRRRETQREWNFLRKVLLE